MKRWNGCSNVYLGAEPQVGLVSQFDINAKKGDVAAAYMGQDPRLLWAKPCLAKFHQHLKKLKQIPKENEPMSSDFLQKNPDVYKKGHRKGWFTEASEKNLEGSSGNVDVFGRAQGHHL
jgi:hypothetical protein